MVLCRKTVDCTLQVGSESLPQAREFKYLEVLFKSEGKMEWEMDRRFSAASAVMRALPVPDRCGDEGAESEGKDLDLPVHLHSNPHLWSWAFGSDRKNEIADTSGQNEFLSLGGWLSLGDRVRSSDIQRELGVEPLLLHVERGQLRWFGHLIRMPPGRLPLEVFRAHPTGKRPQGRAGEIIYSSYKTAKPSFQHPVIQNGQNKTAF